MAIESYKFPAGLSVIVDEVPTAHTTGVEFVVNVGGLDETEEEAGLSHLIEHTVHKGSRLFVDTQARLSYERFNMYSGNAATGTERTVYYARGANGLAIIRGLSSLVLNPILADKDIDHEIEVVTREAKMDVENMDTRFTFARLQAITESPYSRPVIGYLDALNFDYQQVRDFYKQHYVPPNMAVITAGKLTLSETVSELRNIMPELDKEAEGDVTPVSQRRPAPVFRPANDFWFPDVSKETNTIFSTGVILDESTAHRISEKEDYSYLIASQLLGREVFHELREEQRLSYDGGCGYSPGWHPSYWTLTAGATVNIDKVDEAREVIEAAVMSAKDVKEEDIYSTIQFNRGGVYSRAALKALFRHMKVLLSPLSETP